VSGTRLATLPFLVFLLVLAVAVAEERPRIYLNGNWSFTTVDSSLFSDVAVDESNWSSAPVPADWKALGIEHSGYAWYRRSFNLSKLPGLRPRFLRFDRIMDEGEVWLNGVRLQNPDPALCDLLKYRQFGSFGYKATKDTPYYHIYPLDWPYMFPIGGAIRLGENHLAVRVLEDPHTPEAGIVGDVYLVLTRPCYISNVNLVPPKEVSTDVRANFTFEVTITNGGPPFDGQLCLSVFDGDSEERGGDMMHVSLGSGEERTFNLSWTYRPRFEKYVARVSILNGTEEIDVVEEAFHGTVVEVRGNRFYVNGERFIFRGVHYPQPKDLDVMKWIGLNGVRTDNPSPRDVELALEKGIVYAPLVGDSCTAIISTPECAETTVAYDRPDSPYNEMEIQLAVLAMRNDPNVIIWNVANEMCVQDSTKDEPMKTYLRTRYLAAHALDPYDRPVCYSNPFWQHYTFWQDVIGTNVYGRKPDIPPTKPLFMTEWGHGLPFLRKSWASVVLNDDWGVMGAALWPGTGSWGAGWPGINDPDPAVRDEFRWGLREFLQDMKIHVVNASDGEGMMIQLENRRFYHMRNVVVNVSCLATGRQLTKTFDIIEPYGTVNWTISGREPVVVRADYTTHGGLKAWCNFSTLTNPDHIYPRVAEAVASYFRYGMRFTVNLTEYCNWNVSIVGPDGVPVDFLSGEGNSISMTWNATARMDVLPKGTYKVILSIRDLAGNQPLPITRYRFPLAEPAGAGIGEVVSVLLLVRGLCRRRQIPL